jgi:hypothetical protein
MEENASLEDILDIYRQCLLMGLARHFAAIKVKLPPRLCKAYVCPSIGQLIERMKTGVGRKTAEKVADKIKIKFFS